MILYRSWGRGLWLNHKLCPCGLLGSVAEDADTVDNPVIVEMEDIQEEDADDPPPLKTVTGTVHRHLTCPKAKDQKEKQHNRPLSHSAKMLLMQEKLLTEYID